MIAAYKDGARVQVTFGTHKESFGVISRVVRRAPQGQDLIYVKLPGVNRDMMYYPTDLELA